MKGIIAYEEGREKEVQALLEEFGLKYIRTLNSLNYIIFKYEKGDEIKTKKLANADCVKEITLENKIKRIYRGEKNGV